MIQIHPTPSLVGVAQLAQVWSHRNRYRVPQDITLGDAKLDVYRLSIRDVACDLDRMAAMLRRLGATGCQRREDQAVIGDEGHDFDPDWDDDAEESHPRVAGLARGLQGKGGLRGQYRELVPR